MSHIIQKFGDWKKINEADLPGRERESGDKNNKIVAIPIDKSTLKLKIVNDADIIDGNGRMTIDGFDALLAWIQSQGEIISYYSALKDLTNNVVVYEVGKDNDRKQVVIFKIYNKNALKMQDPTQPGINSQVRFVSSTELAQALGGAILNTKAISNIVSGQTKGSNTSTTGFKLPYPIAAMMDSTDPKLISFVILAYNKILTEPRAKAAPIMANVRAEAGAKKLGQSSQLFIKAINAGFAIPDSEFAGEIEADEITQKLVDMISYTAESKEFYLDLSATRIVESESDVIRGFDVGEFLGIANSSQANTGDIKVPATGFIEGMQNNPELKKFQDLLAKKFARHLANHSTYQAFKKAGAKGYLGNYGSLTSALVKLLKIIAENPKYPNNNGSVIEPEFVNMVQKVNESVSNYIGLDGMSLIIESEFNFANAETVAPSKSTTTSTRNLNTQNNNSNKVDSNAYFLQGKNDYSYFVKDKVWYSKKDKGPLTILLNPSSIKTLIEKAPSADGHFIKIVNTGGVPSRADKHLYKVVNKVWNVSLNGVGAWEKVNDPKPLIDTYGIGGVTSSSSAGGTISKDAMAGLAHNLILAMDDAGTVITEIVRVYKKIKTKADLVALHTAFKKDSANQDIALSYWLRDDLDSEEWSKVFAVIKANGLIDSLAAVELKYVIGSDNPATVYFNTYLAIYKRAIKSVKK
jgi:hypothetical protein